MRFHYNRLSGNVKSAYGTFYAQDQRPSSTNDGQKPYDAKASSEKGAGRRPDKKAKCSICKRLGHAGMVCGICGGRGIRSSICPSVSAVLVAEDNIKEDEVVSLTAEAVDADSSDEWRTRKWL